MELFMQLVLLFLIFVDAYLTVETRRLQERVNKYQAEFNKGMITNVTFVLRKFKWVEDRFEAIDEVITQSEQKDTSYTN